MVKQRELSMEEELLATLMGLNQVVLHFTVRSHQVYPQHFPSIEAATNKIEEIFGRSDVLEMWVGVQLEQHRTLRDLLRQLSEVRGFAAAQTADKNGIVYKIR